VRDLPLLKTPEGTILVPQRSGIRGMSDQTAWTMAHKLRHGLSEDPARPLHGFLEADETFIGGRGDPTSRGRSTASPDKSLIVAAVEKVPAPQNKTGKHGSYACGFPCRRPGWQPRLTWPQPKLDDLTLDDRARLRKHELMVSR
jgi:hypothetical protein